MVALPWPSAPGRAGHAGHVHTELQSRCSGKVSLAGFQIWCFLDDAVALPDGITPPSSQRLTHSQSITVFKVKFAIQCPRQWS